METEEEKRRREADEIDITKPTTPPDDIFRQAARVVIELNREALEKLANL